MNKRKFKGTNTCYRKFDFLTNGKVEICER